MAATHNQLIDFIKQFRRELSYIVLERLEMVRLLIEFAMPEHLADRVVMVHEFEQAIVIDV
jgi:hypothetical protein